MGLSKHSVKKKISPATFGLYPSAQGFCFCQQQPEVPKRKTILIKCQKRSDQKQLVHPDKYLLLYLGFFLVTVCPERESLLDIYMPS